MRCGDPAIMVAALPALDLPALRTMWIERYGAAPALRSAPLLRQLLAWRLQAEAHGGLERSTARALKRKGSGEVEIGRAHV